MHRTIRVQKDNDDRATLWADSTYLGQTPILLAELHFHAPHESNHYWYWITASCVFAHWLGGVKTVGSLREAEEIGLLFLRYLGELQTLLEVEI